MSDSLPSPESDNVTDFPVEGNKPPETFTPPTEAEKDEIQREYERAVVMNRLFIHSKFQGAILANIDNPEGAKKLIASLKAWREAEGIGEIISDTHSVPIGALN